MMQSTVWLKVSILAPDWWWLLVLKVLAALMELIAANSSINLDTFASVVVSHVAAKTSRMISTKNFKPEDWTVAVDTYLVTLIGESSIAVVGKNFFKCAYETWGAGRTGMISAVRSSNYSNILTTSAKGPIFDQAMKGQMSTMVRVELELWTDLGPTTTTPLAGILNEAFYFFSYARI